MKCSGEGQGFEYCHIVKSREVPEGNDHGNVASFLCPMAVYWCTTRAIENNAKNMKR